MEEYLVNLEKIAPREELMKMRSLDDLHPFLPARVGGLYITVDDSIRGKTARQRMGSFVTLSNTPATQELSRPYLPTDIVKLFEKHIDRDYDEELVEWEGGWEKILKPRGGRNPFHLLEQALRAGPSGDPVKRGQEPYDWDVFYKAVDSTIEGIKSVIGDEDINPKHLVVCTPSSTRRGLRIAHVMKNSAGEPFFSDPTVKKTSKAHNLGAALRMTHDMLQPENTSLPMWPSLIFARGDRSADWDLYLDNEASRSQAVLSKRDRKIDAQSFILQMMDGIYTQAFMDKVSMSDYPQIDMREPTRLSNHFQDGLAILERLGDNGFSIGSDESAWDQFVTAQSWYAAYLIYRAMFPAESKILTVFSEHPLLITDAEIARYDNLLPGERITGTFRYMDGMTERKVECELEATILDNDRILRRVFAGASGTSMRLGNIIVDGFTYTLDTPRDGKILLGSSMRSGNFCTFKANSDINIFKFKYIEIASNTEKTVQDFIRVHGYRPPPMKLHWFVCRGDDAAQVWEISDTTRDWKISQLVADWIKMTGGLANAEKQETTDERGRYLFGFAQKFVSETWPRGVSSAVRVAERILWNESDEVVLDDPDSGEDLRPYLRMMSSYGRINNLWGVWESGKHPRRQEVTSLIQDLDVEDRIMPPLDEKARRLSSIAYALRLIRRGQGSPETLMSASQTHFWGTALGEFVTQRRSDNPRLNDNTWAPLTRYGTDSRPKWRS